jgi:hypothetical protein
MSIPLELNRQQLEKLDKTELIELVEAMQQQLAQQAALIQGLSEQVAERSYVKLCVKAWAGLLARHSDPSKS